MKIVPPKKSTLNDVDQYGNIMPPRNTKEVDVKYHPLYKIQTNRWSFTKLYPKYEDYRRIYRYIDAYTDLVFCHEYAPSTGVHIQGYFEFKNAVGYPRLRNCYPKFFISPSIWDRDTNHIYVGKSGNQIFTRLFNNNLTESQYVTILREASPTKK